MGACGVQECASRVTPKASKAEGFDAVRERSRLRASTIKTDQWQEAYTRV
jgi:hypothetical protein